MSISAIYLNESLLGAGRDQCVGIDALALKLSKSFILSSVASEGFSVLITVPCRKQVLERVMTLAVGVFSRHFCVSCCSFVAACPVLDQNLVCQLD